MQIFSSAATRRPDPDLFRAVNIRFGERLAAIVKSQEADYAAAQVVILGCPQDEGVRRNDGRPGAAQAPGAIRRCLYKLTANHVAVLKIFDLGDTIIAGTLEQTHDLHRNIVRQVLQDEKRLVVLGGGNDISFPDCAALSTVCTDILAINIDAHFDVRDSEICNSGTPYRQLLDGNFIRPESFFEIGYQDSANAPVFFNYLQSLGVNILSRQSVRVKGMRHCLEAVTKRPASAIFWGFDLDSVCSADAPGVSAPNPTGLSADELCLAAEIAGADPRTRIVEFSEVNPVYDIDNRTSRLTAIAIYGYLKVTAKCLQQGT